MKIGNIYSDYKKGYMSPSKDKDGYLEIILQGETGPIYTRIATLVAYNFIGPPPDFIKDPTVDHIDGNILNNNVENLRWLERSENTRIATRVSQMGSKNSQAKLTEKDVIAICDLLMKNELSFEKIGRIFNVTKSMVSKINRKLNWSHITQHYNFPKRSN